MPKKTHCQNFLHTIQHLKANKAQIPQKQLFSLYRSVFLRCSVHCKRKEIKKKKKMLSSKIFKMFCNTKLRKRCVIVKYHLW